MSARLADLQQRVAAALAAPTEDFERAARTLRADILGAGLDPLERLSIYRNNVRANYTRALELAFPATRRLVGTDYFAMLAGRCFEREPSRSGNIHPAGGCFARWLRERLEASGELPWLPDVAALEWAWQECLVAEDAGAALDVAALGRMAPEALARLRFTTQPALRLVRSRWPVFTIWNANRGDLDPEGTIDLDAGAQYVVLRRDGEGAEARVCDEAEWHWLAALRDRRTFGAAVEVAVELDASFDLAAALRRAIAGGVVSRLET